MKLVSVDIDEGLAAILFEDSKSFVLLRDVLDGRPRTFNDFIQSYSEEDIARLKDIENAPPHDCALKISDARLLAPIPSSLRDIICVGVNYYDHLEETRVHFYKGEFETPEKTVYFSKRGVLIVGPDGGIPSHSDLDVALDYEAELAVIIGKKADASVEYGDIGDCVFGYTIFNDISARTLQSDHVQWYLGKSLDGFAAMGPFIRYRDDYPSALELDIESRVNGETRQRSNTRLLRKTAKDIVYELSRGMTLLPGDIISTGTPSGVGLGFSPPKWMKKGDVVECQIETLGVLRNTIV